jgi:hypothetical protein
MPIPFPFFLILWLKKKKVSTVEKNFLKKNGGFIECVFNLGGG